MIKSKPISTLKLEVQNPVLIHDIERFEWVLQHEPSDGRVRDLCTMSRAIMFRLGPPQRVPSRLRRDIGELFTRAAHRVQSSKLRDKKHLAAGLCFRRRLLISNARTSR